MKWLARFLLIGVLALCAGWTHGAPPPTVQLNFAANSATGCSTLTSCLSVTRSTTETCEPIGGTITYATSGNLCITAEGLQQFEAGTNLIPQSQATTGWTVSSNDTFAAGSSGTAPDATADALVLTDSANAQVHSVTSAAFSVVSGDYYVVSFFGAAGVAGSGVTTQENHIVDLAGVGAAFLSGIKVDLAACTNLGGIANNARILPPKQFASGWCKFAYIVEAAGSASVQIKVAMDPGLPTFNASPSYTGNGSTVLLWGFDVKHGSTLLPYCPSSIGTCNMDVITDGGADTHLATALHGAALRVVANVAEFYGAQPEAQRTILGVGTALVGLGVSDGTTSNHTAQTGWPSTATLASAGLVLPGFTNNIGLSADGSGRSLAMNGQTAVGDSNGLSATTTEYIGSKSDGTGSCNCIMPALSIWPTRSDAAMETATTNANAPTLLTSYIGPIAGHIAINNEVITSCAPTCTAYISFHFRTTNNTTHPQFVLGNFYQTNSGTAHETGPGAASTVTMAVSYGGSCTRIKFSGANSGSIPDNGVVLTDQPALTIPADSDAIGYVYLTNTNGIVAQGQVAIYDTLAGDAMDLGGSDGTATCAAVTNNSARYYPAAIVGPTQLPTACLLGDSRLFGYADVISDQSENLGQVQRWAAPYYGNINIATSGDSAANFVTQVGNGYTNRQSLLQYCSGLIVEYGGNDIFQTGNSAATTETALSTIYGYASLLNGGVGGKAWATTTPGQSCSTDSFETATNQTVYGVTGCHPTTPSTTTENNLLNTWIRANTAGIAGYFETANPVQTAQNSGLWCFTGYAFACVASDALHQTEYANWLTANSVGFQKLQFLLQGDLHRGAPANDNDDTPVGLNKAA